MIEAVPSPYDISPLPRFPYEPGISEWLMLCALVVCGCLALWVLRRRGKSFRAVDPARAALEELQRLAQGQARFLSPFELARLSILLRRLCGWKMGADLGTATTRELETRLASTPEPSLIQILKWCILIDGYKYRPPSDAGLERGVLNDIRSAVGDIAAGEPR